MSYEDISKEAVLSNFQSSLAEALSQVEDVTPREKRQYVYMREPDVNSDSFDGYPYLYLEDYSVNLEAATTNGHIFTVPGTAEIVIDARDEDADMKMLHDELSDNIVSTFMISERYNLADHGWADLDLQRNSRATTVQQDGNPIIRRTVVFSFEVLVDFNEHS